MEQQRTPDSGSIAKSQTTSENTDTRKQQLELQILELDKRVRENELTTSQSRWTHLSIPGATVIVAIIGFAGSYFATYVQRDAAQQLVEQQAQADLMLKSITDDAAASAENIKFLVETGMLDDPEGKIIAALENSNLSITLPRLAKSNQAILVQDDVTTISKEIAKVMNVRLPLKIVSAEGISSAQISLDTNGQAMLMYSPIFFDELHNSTNSSWSFYFVVAHEIAHLALGHLHTRSYGYIPGNEPKPITLGNPTEVLPVPPVDSPNREIDADFWAGNALARLGAKLNDTLAAVRVMPGPGTPSHPPQADRLAAVKRGWEAIDK